MHHQLISLLVRLTFSPPLATTQLLMSSNTFAGVPPSTYGVVWSKYEPERLVTYGQNHIKLWTLSPDPKVSGLLTNKNTSGVFDNVKTHTVLSACFLPSGVVLSGKWCGAIRQVVWCSQASGVVLS